MAHPHPQESNGFDELQRLNSENARLQEELDECKLRLLALLRDESQLPDITIKIEYEKLRTAIETWIDDNLLEDELRSDSRSDFEDTFDRAVTNERHGGILRDLLLYDDAHPSGSGQKYNKNDQWNERFTWLKLQRYRNVIVVTSMIWRFLRRRIFALEFPLGTMGNEEKSRRDRTHAGLLHDIYTLLLANGSDRTSWDA